MSESKVAQLEAILCNGGGRDFSEQEIQQLSRYYQLVLKWNQRLHLTTLTQPEQFFQRHVFESALAESHLLPAVRQLWDLGSGLGIPGLPLAVLRPDLQVYLVESGRNKVFFLEEVVATLELANVRVVESRIESLETLPDDSCLTARAVEKMEQILREMLRIGEGSLQMVILGTEAIKDALVSGLADDWLVQSHQITGSERSLIINATRST